VPAVRSRIVLSLKATPFTRSQAGSAVTCDVGSIFGGYATIVG
jgi:hypothetical protein